MIEINLVPSSVRQMVQEAQVFTSEDWAEITRNWNPFYHDVVRIFRNMSESERIRILRSGGNDLESLVQEMGGLGGDGVILIPILCLSDDKLDLIISVLPQ